MDYGHGEDDVNDTFAVRRNKIAQDMWDSYQRVLEARREDESNDDEDDDEDYYNSDAEEFYNDNLESN